MPFAYFEITRRQLAAQNAEQPPLSEMTPLQRSQLRTNNNNSMGNVIQSLNDLGTAGWELVSVVESRDYNGELLYTFKKTI